MPYPKFPSDTTRHGAPRRDEPAVTDVAITSGDVSVMVILAGLALMMQVAISIMIPALPDISRSLDASPLWGGLTLTAFMMGYGFAPLILGPLSDRFGRRPVLIWGLTLYTAASVACTLASSIELLVTARLLQGIGGGAGLVNSRAIARDLFAGAKYTRVNAYLSTGQGLGPMLAPLVGALLQEQFGWRSTFAFTAIFGAALLLAYWTSLGETNRHRLTQLDISAPKDGYREILKSRQFLRPVFTMSFSFASWYAFFASAPVFFIEHLGKSPSEFGVIIFGLVTGFVAATIFAGRKAATWGEVRLISAGRLLAFVGVAGTALLTQMGVSDPYAIVAPMLLNSLGGGLLAPLLTAAALRPFPHIAGTASSLSIAVFQSICASGTVAAGLVAGYSPHAFFAVMLALQCASVMAHRLLRPSAETLNG